MWFNSGILYVWSQVLQRSRGAILALELLTMLNEGVEVDNMMEEDFDLRQFQVPVDQVA